MTETTSTDTVVIAVLTFRRPQDIAMAFRGWRPGQPRPWTPASRPACW